MDPVLLGLLQQTQNQPQSQMQSALPLQNGPQMVAPPQFAAITPQTAPSNPFDVGIKTAIESARESLQPTKIQRDKALRNALLRFGENIGKEPKERGIFRNFAAVGRAAIPAMLKYGEEEAAAEAANQGLATQIQNRLAQEEESKWLRDYREDQLAEQKRYHDLMHQLGHERIERKSQSNSGNVSYHPLRELFLAKNLPPIEGKSERLVYAKDKKATGEILHELEDIQKKYNEFKELTANDLIGPMVPYGLGRVANEVKDIFGYFTNNKELRHETKKREALNSDLDKFAVALERKLKGGVLSEGMLKRFENKNILPSLRNDKPEAFEEKLNNLIHEVEERYKTSDASLKYGVHLSPFDIIKMQDANGRTISIPAIDPEAIEDALNDQFIPVEE